MHIDCDILAIAIYSVKIYFFLSAYNYKSFIYFDLSNSTMNILIIIV